MRRKAASHPYPNVMEKNAREEARPGSIDPPETGREVQFKIKVLYNLRPLEEN